MKTIEVNGRTVDEALETALKELKVDKDKVTVEIIDEGSRGFLNLIGAKPARIKVTVKRNAAEDAKVFLHDVLEVMGVNAKLDIKEEKGILSINISGDKMGLVIGYRGETLDSIQYLVSLVVNKIHELPHKKVILDTENYRNKREETLKGVAIKTANKVKKTSKVFKLEPMNPYERRIIHSTLQGHAFVNTYSEGEEPFRRVVVELKKDL